MNVHVLHYKYLSRSMQKLYNTEDIIPVQRSKEVQNMC